MCINCKKGPTAAHNQLCKECNWNNVMKLQHSSMKPPCYSKVVKNDSPLESTKTEIIKVNQAKVIGEYEAAIKKLTEDNEKLTLKNIKYQKLVNEFLTETLKIE